jgi:hypothetical protein
MTDSRTVAKWVFDNFPADHEGYFGGGKSLDTNAAVLQLAGNFRDSDHNEFASGDDDNVCLWFTRKSHQQVPDPAFPPPQTFSTPCADKCKPTDDIGHNAPYGYYRTCVPKQQLQSMADSRGVSAWVQRNFPADHEGYFGDGKSLDTNAAALKLAGNFSDMDHNEFTSGDDDNVCLWFTRDSFQQVPDAPFGESPPPNVVPPKPAFVPRKAPVRDSFEDANAIADVIIDTVVPTPLQGIEHSARRAILGPVLGLLR